MRPDLQGLTLTQTLHALGYGHCENAQNNYTRSVFRLSDGQMIGNLTASDCWEWLRDEGYDV